MFWVIFPLELQVHEADCALTYGVSCSIYHIALVALGRERNARQIRTRRCNRWFRENAVFGLRLPVSGKIIASEASNLRLRVEPGNKQSQTFRNQILAKIRRFVTVGLLA